jgi:hypothetical protein
MRAYSSEDFRSIAFSVPDLWSKVSKFRAQNWGIDFLEARQATQQEN